MKFVHCADLHLDTAFSGLTDGKKAAVRQAELRRTFLSIIDLAKTADTLLIAGDLFDQNSVEAETIRVLRAGFASLEHTQVFIVAGNHDSLNENSYYKIADFSDNVHVFGTELECVTVADCDVYGISFRQMMQEEALLKNFRKEGERPAVLLMHGDLGGGAYNPVDRDMIAASGLSYVALGHVHSYAEEMLGKTVCAYPGCPEGRGFDELGEKGVIVGEVTSEGVSLHFEPICQRRYVEQKVSVAGLTTQEEMIGAIRASGLNETDLYKIILTGETDLVPDVNVLAGGFPECFFLKVYDETKRPLDVQALISESGLKGMFAQKMLSGLEGDNRELFEKALEYGLKAIEGEKVKVL
ncbi:MAG: DNA repair exonuclease [Clostridia bacterium]|nr:DNA repair exonuclease [Clostridia bacterium]